MQYTTKTWGGGYKSIVGLVRTARWFICRSQRVQK